MGPYEEIKNLKEELEEARRTIIELMPEKLREILQSYYLCAREQRDTWEYEVTKKIIEAAEILTAVPWYNGERAYCPLCRDGSSWPGDKGFSVPLGLERHLRGAGGHRCGVMRQVARLARQYWHETYHAQDEAERLAAEQRIKERKKSETLYRIGPGDKPQLFEQGIWVHNPARSPEQLTWAEKRLEELGFKISMDGNVKSYIREHDAVAVYADPRGNGEITFLAYRKLLPGQRLTPRRSRVLDSFSLRDSWRHKLLPKYESFVSQTETTLKAGEQQ